MIFGQLSRVLGPGSGLEMLLGPVRSFSRPRFLISSILDPFWIHFGSKREAWLGQARPQGQHLFCFFLKVKGKTIKDKAKIPTNVDIALSNIDLVIQEVLNKPTARIYA